MCYVYEPLYNRAGLLYIASVFCTALFDDRKCDVLAGMPEHTVVVSLCGLKPQVDGKVFELLLCVFKHACYHITRHILLQLMHICMNLFCLLCPVTVATVPMHLACMGLRF